MTSKSCPCGTGKKFTVCCGPYLTGRERPETAEQLMRSRYSAYVTQNIDYLKETLWPKYQPRFDAFDVAKWASESHWTGLDVLDCQDGGVSDRKGTVLFEARYLTAGTLHTHHELSLFKKQKGRWYYLEALD